MKIIPQKTHRQDNRRRRGNDWRACLRVGAILMIAGIGALAVYAQRQPIASALTGAGAFIFDNDYFSLREIQVLGGEKAVASEIVALAGLRHGMNLWKVDAAAIEKKIVRHPWVRRVLVRREFPRRVLIRVEERQPRAVVALGKLYYVDSEGSLFKEVGVGEQADFPLLTGLRADDLAAGGPALRRRMQEAIALAELMNQGARKLSEIHFAGPDQVVAYMAGRPIALRMGWGDWPDKVRRMERVLALWQGHEERLASLDMRFRDQVVARLRRAKQS